LRGKGAPPMGWIAKLRTGVASLLPEPLGRWMAPPPARELYYFEEVLPREFDAVNKRRKRHRRGPVKPLPTEPLQEFADLETRESPRFRPEGPGKGEGAPTRALSPDKSRLFPSPGSSETGEEGMDGGGNGGSNGGGTVDPAHPEHHKMRPRPVPCDTTGLALSGGGIRSAAVCLGALQALDRHGRLGSLDYLSTVSGGGYMGACLSAAMTGPGGGAFPFGADVSDSPAVAHLRNYSNYLLPRGRSGIRNLAEAAVVVLRGLLANAIIVAAFIFAIAAATLAARPLWGYDYLPPVGLAASLAAVLLVWATLRAFVMLEWFSGDTSGPVLRLSRWLLISLVIASFVALQPVAIGWFAEWQESAGSGWAWLKTAAAAASAFAVTIATLAAPIGRFLENSQRVHRVRTLLLRLITKAALVLAGMALPVAVWLIYLWLCARATRRASDGLEQFVTSWIPRLPDLYSATTYGMIAATLGLLSMALTPNAYSLHRFYRDRLSKAFQFGPVPADGTDPAELKLRLSDLSASEGPYHLINAAMNVQGSEEANRRGRNADFFMFSSDFVGSDLTFYARTRAGSARTLEMEAADPRLDLATAMAISGAAVSANMGSSTVRVLSPMLALLNIRLGYWMPNPRHLAVQGSVGLQIGKLTRRATEKLFLLSEMLNLHDEKSSNLFLTDGGHIENLGLYELLKRGCQLIVVVDAEADPELAFSSLLKVERYARIDLGVRIILPWEELATRARHAGQRALQGRHCRFGPHCAVGQITYENGSEGVLIYFKATLSGDEKDYVIDYKRRNPDFPHETTGDQFFSEEQFEMYRALGSHMVDGFFSGSDEFICRTPWRPDLKSIPIRALVERLLPPVRPVPVP
jgi:hypothetical protein